HGLRKAGCRRLAELGCSANQIAAWSGHATLREIERYTKAADQARMARAAMARGQNISAPESVTPIDSAESIARERQEKIATRCPGLDRRHLDRRHQRQPDRRQRA